MLRLSTPLAPLVHRPSRLALAMLMAASLALAGCQEVLLEPERPPETLRVTPDSVSVEEGKTIGLETLRVEVLDETGTPIEPTPAWVQDEQTWSVADPSVADLDEDEVSGRAPGQTTAEVRVAGLRAEVPVEVRPRALLLRAEAAYLTQVVQRLDGSVPLVAGREALARVFLTGDEEGFGDDDLTVRVRLFRGGQPAGTLTATGERLSGRFSEATLSGSWNVPVPARLVQPGLEMLVEVEPEASVPIEEGSVLTFPANGTPQRVVVEEMPRFVLRMVPIRTGTGSTGAVTEGNLDDYLAETLRMLPIGAYDAQVVEPFATDASLSTRAGWVRVLNQVAALRAADGQGGFYYGLLPTSSTGGGLAGLGQVGGFVSVGIDALPFGAHTVAHELGHNFGRRHAPCGDPAGIDGDYPYTDARIGVYGFDTSRGVVRGPQFYDLMSYCDPVWISDYTFEGILNYRLVTGAQVAPGRPMPEPALLVWGRVGEGTLALEPAFALDAVPQLPEGGGPYALRGYDADGALLFDLPFAGTPVSHGRPDDRTFAFALPASMARPDRLARLELSGPGATPVTRAAEPTSVAKARPAPRVRRQGGDAVQVAWDRDQAPAATLVLDGQTGRVLGIAHGADARVYTSASVVEVLASDGVRTTRSRLTVR